MGIESLISWILQSVASIILMIKSFFDVKDLIEKKGMPDIKEEDKVEEITRKQELAKSLVVFAGIEAAYYTARSLVIAINFAMIMHFAYKFVALWRRGSEEKKEQ